MRIFLDLPGLDGTGDIPGLRTAFELADFNLAIDSFTATNGTGGNNLSAIGITLGNLSFETMLLLRAANDGVDFGRATIKVMGERDGQLIEVERLTLEGVQVALVTSADGGASQAALTYDKITIRSNGFNADGTPNGKLDSSVSYTITDTPVTGEPVNVLIQPQTGSFQPSLGADAHRFVFAKIEGIKGDSVNVAFKDQFQLAGVDLDLQKLLTLQDSTSGRLAPVSMDFDASAPGLTDLIALSVGSKKIDLTYVFDGLGPLSNAPKLAVSLSQIRILGVERLDGTQTRVTFAFDTVTITGDAKDGSSFAPITATGLLDRFDRDARPMDNGLFYDTDTPLPHGTSDLSYRLAIFDGNFPATRPVDDDLTDAEAPAGMLTQGFEHDLLGDFQFRRGGGAVSSFTTEGFAIDLPSLGSEGRQFWADVGQEIGNLRFVIRDATGAVTGYFELTDAYVAGFAQQAGFADRLMLGFSRLVEFKLVETPTGSTFKPVFDSGTGPRATINNPGLFDPTDLAPEWAEGGTEFSGFFFTAGFAGSSQTEGFEDGLVASSFALSATPVETPFGLNPGETPDIALSQFTLDFAAGNPDVQKLIQFATTEEVLPEVTFFLTVPGPGGETVYSAWRFTDLRLNSVVDGSGKIRLGFTFDSVQMVDAGLEGATKGFVFPSPTDDVLTIGTQSGGGQIGFDGNLPGRQDSTPGADGEIRLQIDGLAGGATDAGLDAPFEVLAYYFRSDAVVTYPPSGNPEQAVPEFTPLVVDFAPGQAGLTGLLAALASGDLLPFGTLYDYPPGADPSDPDFAGNRREIDLTGLQVLGYSETAEGSVRVIFGPSTMTLRQMAGGGVFSEQDVIFEGGGLNAHLIDDGSFDAGPRAVFDGFAQAFLDFDQKNVTGGSVVAGFEDQYEALDFGLDLTGLATGDAAVLSVVLPNNGPGLTRLLDHTRNGEGFPTLKLSLAAQGPDGLVTYQMVTLYNVFLDQARRGTDTTTVRFTATLADVDIATLDENGFIALGRPGALGDAAPGFSEIVLDAGTNDVVRGTSSNDQLNGGDGDDDLSGAEGFDVLLGGAGNDTLRVSDLADVVDGGDGIDTLDMSGFAGPQGLNINLTAGSVSMAGTTRTVAFVDIDNAVGSGRDDTITGSASDNVIEGGAGADVMDGGEGNNTLSYKGSSIGVLVDLETQSASLGDAEGDSFVNFVHIEGSSHDDTLTGDDARNRIFGGAGNDVLTGSGDFDFLFGGSGNDRLVAGVDETAFSGNEIYRGGDGFDTMVFFGNGGFVNAINRATFAEIERLEFSIAVHGGGGRYIFTSTQFDSIEVIRAGGRPSGNPNRIAIDILADGVTGIDLSAVNVVGFGLSDSIAISGHLGARNTIIGSSVRDLIFGQELADRLVGGEGRDAINGGGDRDRLEGGLGNDKLSGGKGNDQVFGEDGNDTVSGGGGRDTVGGGLGRDLLSGNAGTDSFRFISFAAMDGDVIRDFGAGETVDFRGAGVVGFGAFDGTAGMIRFRTQGGNGFLEADIDGDSAVDFTLTLNGVGSFDAGSLIF